MFAICPMQDNLVCVSTENKKIESDPKLLTSIVPTEKPVSDSSHAISTLSSQSFAKQ